MVLRYRLGHSGESDIFRAQVTDLRLRGFFIGERDAVLLGGLSRLQRLQFKDVAFDGRTLISKLSSLQVTHFFSACCHWLTPSQSVLMSIVTTYDQCNKLEDWKAQNRCCLTYLSLTIGRGLTILTIILESAAPGNQLAHSKGNVTGSSDLM